MWRGWSRLYFHGHYQTPSPLKRREISAQSVQKRMQLNNNCRFTYFAVSLATKVFIGYENNKSVNIEWGNGSGRQLDYISVVVSDRRGVHIYYSYATCRKSCKHYS